MFTQQPRDGIAPSACFLRPATFRIDLEITLPIRQRFVVRGKLLIGEGPVEQSDRVVRALGEHFAEKLHRGSIIDGPLLLFRALKMRGSEINQNQEGVRPLLQRPVCRTHGGLIIPIQQISPRF